MGTCNVRTAVLCGAVVGLLVFGGCVPEFENPVDESKAQQVDKQLLGSWWRTEDNGSVQQVSFLPRAESKKLDVVYAFGVNSPRARRGAGVNTYEAFSVDLGGKYLCLQRRDTDWRRRDSEQQEESEPYYIVSYELREDGKLEMRMLSLDKFKQFVQDEKLAGTVEEGDANGRGRSRWDSVKVTASTAELTTFLEKTPAEQLVSENERMRAVFNRDVKF